MKHPIVALLFVFAACGGDDGESTSTACTAANATATTSVSLDNDAFNPACIRVSPGATVTFTNTDNEDHTATADNGSFDSGTLAPNASFPHTFATAGTVPMHCNFHSGMRATVIVE
jgi:plastocyanin